ncbi:MAG: hypothetical protein BGO20_17375 [Bosea sp. 67-29]|nr:MAG: hypothetical protein BGO20_17375 [Bosea sp. 67-29]
MFRQAFSSRFSNHKNHVSVIEAYPAAGRGNPDQRTDAGKKLKLPESECIIGHAAKVHRLYK